MASAVPAQEATASPAGGASHPSHIHKRTCAELDPNPAYPLENVIDPTGAGDSFAGGLVGYLAAHRDEELTDDLMRRAMAYGTAIASYNVEEFGTERVQRLTADEITARVADLRGYTSFADAPVPLR